MTAPPAAAQNLLAGLTSGEVAARRAAGQVNLPPPAISRTVPDILRANLLTRFNLVLSALLAAVLVIGPLQDAVFALVMVFNSAIGIIQELRAKRALDRLALVTVPSARAVRDGRVVEIPTEEVVLGDLLVLGPGDQVVVDGTVLEESDLEIDESLLTGEAEPVAKSAGDRCLSGSLVMAGRGSYLADRVGADTYAAGLTVAARAFGLARSELRAALDRLLRWIGWLILPVGGVLLLTGWRAGERPAEALRGAISGMVGLIPQGLVLLLSAALAMGVARLARQRVLTQELAAVEGLARVDVVCFDKTGTLTEGRLRVLAVEPLGGGPEAGAPLGAVAGADPSPNATLRAIATAFPPPEGWQAAEVAPFSSERRWCGASFPGHGVWALGAPEVVTTDPVLAARAAELAGEGIRVLALAACASLPEGGEGRGTPAALVLLGDEVRPDAAATVAYFARQGVALKVISGDHPATVGSIARRVGIAGPAVDAADLPAEPAALAAAMEGISVLGRVTPEQKRDVVRALTGAGHVVAMTGDGVNDVLALKAADIAVAIGSGSAACRSIAHLILVDGDFRTLPEVVAEGRRVIGNIERVANLYLTKTCYALLLALSVGIAGLPFPLLPRHYTLVGSLTIGIPSLFLALEATAQRVRPGFLGRVLRFALPTGAVAGAAGFGAYVMARLGWVSLDEARTTTTLVLLGIGLLALLLIARPHTRPRVVLTTGLLAAAAGCFLVTPVRDFYALDLPHRSVLATAIAIVAGAGLALRAGLIVGGWLHRPPRGPAQGEPTG